VLFAPIAAASLHCGAGRGSAWPLCALGRTAGPARTTATNPFRARGFVLHLRLQLPLHLRLRLPLHLRLRLPLLLRPVARQVRLAFTETLGARRLAVGLLDLQLPLLLRPVAR
jgi:hypothetical protein